MQYIIKTNTKTKIVPLHADIGVPPFDQSSPQPPGEGVLNCHRQTHGNRNSKTESAQ